MSDRAARGAAGAAAAHGSGFSPAPEDGQRQQPSRNYAWTEFDESRLQGSVTAARLCGGGRVTVDRQGIVSIEVRHSHEEPPPVVEKVKELLLQKLDIMEQKQQRWVAKAQAKADSSDASAAKKPSKSAAKRARQKAERRRLAALGARVEEQQKQQPPADAAAPAVESAQMEVSAPQAAPEETAPAPGEDSMADVSTAREPQGAPARVPTSAGAAHGAGDAEGQPPGLAFGAPAFGTGGSQLSAATWPPTFGGGGVDRRRSPSPRHPPRRGCSRGLVAAAPPTSLASVRARGEGAERALARLPLASAVAPRA